MRNERRYRTRAIGLLSSDLTAGLPIAVPVLLYTAVPALRWQRGNRDDCYD
jgi:hypothetical protein